MIFIGVIVATVIVQFLLVTFGGSFAGTKALNGAQWATTVFIGSLSIPIATLGRFIPVVEASSDFHPIAPIVAHLAEEDSSARASYSHSTNGVGLVKVM